MEKVEILQADIDHALDYIQKLENNVAKQKTFESLYAHLSAISVLYHLGLLDSDQYCAMADNARALRKIQGSDYERK